MNNSAIAYVRRQEVSLFELWDFFWANKWSVVGLTVLFTIGSVISALSQPDIYRAEALVVPAKYSQSTNPLVGQFASIETLAGIQIGGGSQTATPIAILRSREFIRNFINKHNLLVLLRASVWDSETKTSIIDSSIYDESTQTWLDGKPSDLSVVSTFKSILRVSEDRSSGIVTIAIEWFDPLLAQQWVNLLVSEINLILKKRDLAEASVAISYLQQKLKATQLLEMQKAFYQLIEYQTRIIMLADVRDDYFFRVIDPAVVPEEKIRPRRSVIVIWGTVLGGLLSLILVLFRYTFRSMQNLPR